MKNPADYQELALKRVLALFSLVLALSACGGVFQDSASAGKQAAGDAYVVVAVVDTAFNPYHEFFHHGPNSPIYNDRAPSSVTPAVLQAVGVTPDRIIEVTRTGNISRDKATDKAQWDAVRRGRPYWFKGTNVIGVSFCPPGLPMLMPDPGKNTHGVGTSAAVLRANPEAVVILVEFCNSVGDSAAEGYAFTHPAVDMISTSYGAGVPGAGFPLPEAIAWGDTFDSVVRMGKMHFSSGGNGSGLTNKRAGAGPWWSIGVSGFEEDSSNGDQQGVSGNFPDFVSDFTQELPYCMDCERGLNPRVPGTSFSTPRAAGVASRVLLETRRQLGHKGGIILPGDGLPVMAQGAGVSVTNWQIRRALEEGAYADYSIDDYDPGGAAGDPWPTSLPVITEAAWLQIGWGDLTSDPEKGVVAGALAYLGFGGPMPEKDPGFCEFQTRIMEERIIYWGSVTPDSGNHQPDGGIPYIFCGATLQL
jgi:hypothetical protein